MDTYKVEYKAGKHSQPLYVTASQNDVDEIGGEWATEKAAANILHTYAVIIKKRKKPCYSLKVVKAGDIPAAPVSQPHADETYAIKSTLSANDQSQDQTVKAETVQDEQPSEPKRKVPERDTPGQELPERKFLTGVEIENALNSWQEIAANLSAYTEHFKNIENEEESRAQDFLHYIELYDVSDDEVAPLFAELHNSRMRRREAKDVLRLLENLKPCVYAAQDVRKELENKKVRVYAPRVEKDLFVGKKYLRDVKPKAEPKPKQAKSKAKTTVKPDSAHPVEHTSEAPNKADDIGRVREFSNECLVYQDRRNTDLGIAFVAYREWCREHGYVPLSEKKMFKTVLQDNGFICKRARDSSSYKNRNSNERMCVVHHVLR